MSVLKASSWGLLGLLVSAQPAFALNPDRHIAQYAHSTWRMQDGYFNGTPEAIAQTSDGYIWIGTSDGLVRFDGVRFVPWSAIDSGSLPSPQVHALLGARDGSLWIGTLAGLSRWKDGHLTNYANTSGMFSGILEDADGNIWVSRFAIDDSSGSVCHVLGSGMQCYGKGDGVLFEGARGQSIAQDASGTFWIGGDTAILRWKPGAPQLYPLDGLKSNSGMGGVVALASTPAVTWAGTGLAGPGLGLLRLVDGEWKPYVTENLDGTKLEIAALLVDRQGSLWIGTASHGIYRIAGADIDHFGASDGLSSDSVWGLFQDAEGDIWVSTTQGLDDFRDRPVVTYDSHEGLAGYEVDSITTSRDGTVWVGGAEALNVLRGGSVQALLTGKGLPGSQPTAMLEDHAGQLWLGIDDGLAVYQNHAFHPVQMPDGSSTGMVRALAEDKDNVIWAEAGSGSKARLLRVEGMRITDAIPASRIPPVQSLAADREQGIWLGFRTGDLARLRAGKLDVFHYVDEAGGSSAGSVRQLLVAANGDVFGATSHGLIAWRNGRQQTLTARNGLPCDGINAIAFDHHDALWLHAQCGLMRIDPGELNRWWLDAGYKMHPEILDILDGFMPGAAPFEAGATSTDGKLWFSNNLVLQMVDPQHPVKNHVIPAVHVEGIVADGKAYPPQTGPSLPAHTHVVEVDYTAPSFVSPQKVRFRYQLEGYDAQWQDPGNRRQAFYSDLPPGNYHFHVIASNNDGVWNDQGDSVAFALLPAWYQTLWFRLLCAGLIVLSAFSFHRLRLARMTSMANARFEERLAERAHLARELHDTLLQTIEGSKMLADVALDEPPEPGYLRGVIARLSGWLGRAIEEERSVISALRLPTGSSADLVENLRRVVDEYLSVFALQVDFKVDGMPRSVHPIVCDEICHVISEAIRNACQHSGASSLQIEIRYAKGITLIVRDNGKGIDPEVLRNGRPGHFGLQGMAERCQHIGGKLTIKSALSAGTQVELTVPGHVLSLHEKRKRWPVLRNAILSWLPKNWSGRAG